MEIVTWKIKKEDFGFPGRLYYDTEYSISDDGIKITKNGQTKDYLWKNLKWFSSGTLFVAGGARWATGQRRGSSGGFKAIFDALSQNSLNFLPRYTKKSFHEFDLYPKRDLLGFGLVRIYVSSSDNIKKVFEALKNCLPLWNNWFLPRLISLTIIGIGSSTFFFYVGYSFVLDNPAKILEAVLTGVVFFIASLLVIYYTFRNIVYFFKLYKQKWKNNK